MNRRFTVALAMLLVLAICIGLGVVYGAPVQVRFATVLAPGDPIVTVMERFAATVKERSKGQIAVNIFPGGTLGGERDNLEALRTGALDIAASSSLADAIFFAPKLAIFSTPYLVKDHAQARKIWAGSVGRQINGLMEDKFGLVTLGLMDRGPRQLTSNRKVESPDDLKGMKIRLPENDVYIRVWKALGAIPVPVALPEAYGALQTGVVEAQENPLATIYSFKFQEVQKYLILTNHIVEMYKIQCSKRWFDKLTASQKRLIRKAMDDSIAYGNKLVADSEDDLLAKLKASGMTVIKPDIKAFRDKAWPTIEELGESYFEPGLFDKVVAITGK